MEATFDRIRDSAKTPGHDRIFIAGEPETLAEQAHRDQGIAVSPPVMEQLEKWSTRLGVGPIT
jgi:LDH2 family malate/lactate/ureidoglycolate dehydrogenase